MTILKKYDPFRELERFFEGDLFGFMPAVKRYFEPAMDIYEDNNKLVAEIQIPKINPKNVHISIEGRDDEPKMLKIEGTQNEEEEKNDESKNYYRKEIRTGHFVRMFRLPVPVKEDTAEASFEDGILKVSIEKGEEKQPKKIEIKLKQS
jgi:HSP20 family protein